MKKIIIILMFMMILPFVSAKTVIETQQSGLSGLFITHPTHLYFPVNTDFELHFHIYNSTGSLIILNPGEFCTLHIYNRTGNHVIQENLTSDSNNVDYVSSVLNFDMKGHFSFIVWCETDYEEGFVAQEFSITENGEVYETTHAYSMMAILIIGTIGLLFSFAHSLEGEKEWIQPLKLLIYIIGLFLLILGLGYGLQIIKLTTELNGAVTNILIWILIGTMFIVVPTLIIFLVMFIKDILLFLDSLQKNKGGGW